MYYKVTKDGGKGKTIISQAVVMKVLGISATAHYNVNEKCPWIFDIIHYGYGRVDVKYSTLAGMGRTEGYRFKTNRNVSIKMGSKRECDTYFLLGFDYDWKNIDTVFVVPNKGWIRDVGTVSMYKSTNDSKYNEFRADVKPYNDAYHDFATFIGKGIMVEVDDVKEWLRSGDDNKKMR